MTIDAAHTAIRQRFETLWGVTTPVQYPNVKFDAPEDAPWVRLSIIDTDARWASMGVPDSNIERHLGQVTVQIFVPSGTGEGSATEYADQVKAIFRSWRDATSGLRFLVPPYARTIGVDGKWYQVNVVAPFEFDDFN
ncbi:structural protein [Pseudanabaena phage Pan1]|nr:structural protein [Pseudanabaena phage Pan1]